VVTGRYFLSIVELFGLKGGDTMTKGKDAKKDAKKKPVLSSAASQGSSINMLNQQPSKKKKEYK
jgi:hypothetical protein